MKKSALPLQNVSKSEKSVYGKEDLVKILRWHFGYSEFRGKQLDAIEAVLSGRDCFCLMPTGGGKSMCYQIPALVKKGIVLVVCPLIALMENQVTALKERGIAAEFLSSTQTSQAKNKIYEDLESGRPSLKLLYVTPELIATQGFGSKLTKLHGRGLLHLIAIDEAHCISTWGHDFRTSYRKLSSLGNRFPDIPILALTATAVPKVQKDVIESLCLRNPLVLKSSFNRHNIYYEVRYKDLLDDPCADFCSSMKSYGDVCAIVYCLERTTCDALATLLSDNGINSAAYHAGLNNKLRTSVLDDWISSKIQVVVATVAFGYLIHPVIESMYFIQDDRKDVRVVCHFNIPKSMESFYQESGRAGRDQLPSTSLLYYGIDDRKRMEFILSNAKSKKSETSSLEDGSSRKSLVDFKQMIDYCEGSGCRRKKILEAFGDQVPPSLCARTCDACKNPNLIAQNLKELSSFSVQQRHRLPPIFMRSASDAGDAEYSEFWDRDDDEKRGSDEEISDSDEDPEVSKCLSSSKLLQRSRLSEKMEILQRAEEKYYKNNDLGKQKARSDKNVISESQRNSCKQKLLNVLKQTQQRLGDSSLDVELGAAFLEEEGYKKYGKSGKSIYLSQLASTVRWLSKASQTDLKNRFADITAPGSRSIGTKGDIVAGSSSPEKPLVSVEEASATLEVKRRSPIVRPSPSVSRETALPPIPSFSDFVKSQKVKQKRPDHPSAASDHSAQGEQKRMRLS